MYGKQLTSIWLVSWLAVVLKTLSHTYQQFVNITRRPIWFDGLPTDSGGNKHSSRNVVELRSLELSREHSRNQH